MAARSSMPVPTIPRTLVCPGSARTTATPIPTGRASARAMNAVETVPNMAGRAPNVSVTGFQSVPTRKRRPNCLIAGPAWSSKVRTRSTRMAGTTLPTTPTTVRNPSRGRLVPTAAIGPVPALTAMFIFLAGGVARRPAVEPVADAAHRHDLERRDPGELLAQPAHMDVDRLAVT